jgi:hypothetical protein
MQIPKEIEVNGRTPEELVQILDARIAFYRSCRTESASQRALILMAVILILVVGTAAGLLMLMEKAPARARLLKGAAAKSTVVERR